MKRNRLNKFSKFFAGLKSKNHVNCLEVFLKCIDVLQAFYKLLRSFTKFFHACSLNFPCFVNNKLAFFNAACKKFKESRLGHSYKRRLMIAKMNNLSLSNVRWRQLDKESFRVFQTENYDNRHLQLS